MRDYVDILIKYLARREYEFPASMTPGSKRMTGLQSCRDYIHGESARKKLYNSLGGGIGLMQQEYAGFHSQVSPAIAQQTLKKTKKKSVNFGLPK